MSKKTLENNGPKQDLQKATEQPQGEMASGPGNDASVGKGEEEERPTNKPETFFDRLVEERGELVNRCMRLDEFVKSDKINTVSDVQRKLLKKQLIAMRSYCDILDLRIEDLREV